MKIDLLTCISFSLIYVTNHFVGSFPYIIKKLQNSLIFRISENAQVAKNMREYFSVSEEDSSKAILTFLKTLISEGTKALDDSLEDFLLASTKKPIYGLFIDFFFVIILFYF